MITLYNKEQMQQIEYDMYLNTILNERDIKETAELLVKKPLLIFSDNEDEEKSEKEELQKERSRSPSPH